MALVVMPLPRMEGLISGHWDGSSGWQRTPGMATTSVSAWKRVVMAHSTSLVSKGSTSSSTRITCLSSEKAENARSAAWRWRPSSTGMRFWTCITARYLPPPEGWA